MSEENNKEAEVEEVEVDTKKLEEAVTAIKSEPAKSGPPVTTLKLGNFSLSTPSFWITIICILCMFMTIQIGFNIYMYNKIMGRFMQHEEAIMDRVVKTLVK